MNHIMTAIRAYRDSANAYADPIALAADMSADYFLPHFGSDRLNRFAEYAFRRADRKINS